MPKSRRVLNADRDAPRFRLVRLWRVQGKVKAEIIGSVEAPSEAIASVFAESGRVLAVDRRGDTYSDNGRPIETRDA